MKRLIALGLVFEVAVLIVGLTWFGEVPPADTGPAGPGSVAAAADGPAYRIYGEGTGRIVEVHLDAVETVQDIAEGVEYRVWTFGGTAPGPVIRVKVGDTVRFTLTNRSVMGLAHSIDFHAAETPWDVNYQPVAPGETLTFDWVARFPGVFMYHCGVPPVLHHIANGMYGAIVVEPEEGLAPAREYVLVASELYAADRAVDGVLEGDVAKMLAPRPTHVVFDGRANRYLDAPLQARPNETIRLWVVNAGPTLSNAFHVIGALFDHVYASGNPTTPLNGLQTWNIPPGDGAMFELRIPAEGLYPFVTHAFAYTGLGSVGVIQVTESAPEAPASYPVMGSPFDGGISEVVGTVDPDNLPGPSGPGGDTGTGGGGMTGPARPWSWTWPSAASTRARSR
ncbi:MAG: multicopper oxidase domain-containing protein [Actinobacteria bacterium]|nr:multicopper oxidase domain-containing protein [Actinomycetota bacterium]